MLPVEGRGEPAAAVAPEWKQQVAERLEQFQQKRIRRHDPAGEEKSEEVPRPDPTQKVLAFEDFAAQKIEPLIVELPKLAPLERRAACFSGAARPSTGVQPEAPASKAPPSEQLPRQAVARDVVCASAVAPLELRSLAAALDLALATVAIGLFWGTFHLLGGALHFNQKAGSAIGLAAAGVVAFYFFLYTVYASETPGLQWMGLCVLDHDGYPPKAGQRLVRALGMLLSAAALGLGYLWALADEEGLTWHDRMSKTFVTREAAAPQNLTSR